MDTEIDTSRLLHHFGSFCGSEKYAKFLCVVNTRAVYKRRFLYWQEKLWLEFCNDHPEYSHLGQVELLDVFRICHIHDQPMLDDQVVAIYGNWRFPEDYLHAHEHLFPFANMMYCGDSVERQRHSNRDVKYCPACRKALIDWNANRKEKIGLP